MTDKLLLSTRGGFSYTQIAEGQAEPETKKIFCYIESLIVQRAKEAFEDLDATYASLHPDSTPEDAWSANTEVAFDFGMCFGKDEIRNYGFKRTPFAFLHIVYRDDTYFCDNTCIKTSNYTIAETRHCLHMSMSNVDLSPLVRTGILSKPGHLDKDAFMDSLSLIYPHARTQIELFRTIWRSTTGSNTLPTSSI